ncbi:MAG: tetratricopeptide repeat protein [Bacteroidales bacterium]|nr:tetratricopeptide repeat protein [Bacteroidales bacterium]
MEKPQIYSTRKNIIPIIIISIFSLIFLNRNIIYAQDYQGKDILKTADSLRNKGKLKKAINILMPYYEEHPNDLDIVELYAGTLFWMKDFSAATNVYKKAIKIYPENYKLKTNYAEILIATNNLDDAEILISEILKKNRTNARIEILSGTIKYYQKDYLSAKKHLSNALNIDPYNKTAKNFLIEIDRILSPWMKINTSYSDDSQPLKNITSNIDAGWYKSHLLSLNFNLGYKNYKLENNSYNLLNFQIENKSEFNKLGIETELAAGIISYSANNDLNYTWKLGLYKNFLKNFNLGLKAERSAYSSSVMSLDELLLRKSYTVFLEYYKEKKWNAKTAFNIQNFPDNNSVKTFYVWVLSPAIKISAFDIYIGYSYNYMNSENNRFASVLPLNEIIENPDEKIQGVYNPYFTPKDQYSHSALCNISIKPSKNIIFKLYSTIGFYSKTKNPYLYLDNNEADEIILKKDYYQTDFTPMNIGGSFKYNLSEKIIFDAEYYYLQTFYFHSNNYKIGIKINL